MSAKGKPPMTVDTKKAIFALRLQGLGNKEIAARLNLHPVTVSKAFSAVKKLEAAGKVPPPIQPQPPADIEVLRDWRGRLTRKSVSALDRGLEDTSDNYKAGALGVSVLKGVGEFSPDHAPHVTNINVLMATMPPEFRERYFGANVSGKEPRQLSDQEHEAWALELFRKSGLSPAEFSQRRMEARAGRIHLITNDEEWNEFFEAEQARAGNNGGSGNTPLELQ